MHSLCCGEDLSVHAKVEGVLFPKIKQSPVASPGVRVSISIFTEEIRYTHDASSQRVSPCEQQTIV